MRVLSIVLLVALAGCMRLDVFVFRPLPAEDPTADLMATSKVPVDLREEITTIESEDGVSVNAYLVKHRADDGTPVARHDKAILYCHGNHTHIGTTVPRVDALWELGFTVLIFDARGFGKTKVPEGELQTEEGVYADARAARAHLEEQYGAANVGLYGRSLGSAICLKLATEKATALLLESPIAGLQQIIDDSTSLDTPVDWYADSQMDNPARAADLTGALLVMHGTEDDYVQPAYGEAIVEQAKKASSAELWLVPGATHGTVPCADHTGSLPNSDCKGGFSEEWRNRTAAFFDAQL